MPIFRLTGRALDEIVMRAEIRDDAIDPDLAPLFDAFTGSGVRVTAENVAAVGEAITEISNRCDGWAEMERRRGNNIGARAQRDAAQGLGTLRINIGRRLGA